MQRPPLPCVLGLFALAACSAETYRMEADAEVYRILGEKRETVFGPDTEMPFKVEAIEDSLRRRLLGELEGGDSPKLHLSLEDALRIAAENSRDFQTQKERLYNSALALTGQRNRYSTIFSGGATADSTGVADKTADGSARGNLSASQILASGARVLGGFVTSFFRVFTSGGGWNTSSLLNLSITQPILAGFGRTVTMEPLTQAERNVVYSVRDYERFRRTFAVTILEEYMSILEQGNNYENQRANFENLKLNKTRQEALSKAGRTPKFEVDQAEQQEFSAQDRVINAQAQLATLIDRFKIRLGLPMAVELELDADVLKRLSDLGVHELGLAESEALEIAFGRRLDWQNIQGSLVDAQRQIGITANALQAGLDLTAAIDVPNEDNKKPFVFDWKNYEWAVGLNLDLPFNRVPQRNVYRQAIIARAAASRACDELEDNIKASIRRALRDVGASWRSYQIQKKAFELATERVNSTSKLIEAGRATTRDYLESESARLQSQNAVTSALVDYVVNKLRLLRDLELLDVGLEGLEIDFAGLERWTVRDASEEKAPESGEPSGPEADRPGVDRKEK
ncbi:MAG: TolC family protein [Planctomycetes bacterium]|nr:TolC family protein [Planctomycetota bacterium]MCB9890460.1 TolC family protein [Planctomycetota bacterium]MCB9917701.1 TolC family protein [Planctomycetota bacterium]